MPKLFGANDEKVNVCRTARKRKIAVFLNGISDYYQHTLCEGIVKQADILDYSVLFFASGVNHAVNENNEGELKLLKLPDMHSFDGIIAATNTITSVETVDYLRKVLPINGMPVVNIGPSINGSYSVDTVDNGSMEALIRHFVSDHQFTRINYISGPPSNPDAQFRLNTFKRVLAEYGIAYDDDRVFSGDFSRECARDAISRFLQCSSALPQAIVCANDNIALGAYAELTRRGLRVPEDIALSGYDGVHNAAHHIPRITTVKQPLFEMGRRTVSIIDDVLMGKQIKKDWRFNAQIVIAGSCGCKDTAPMDERQLVKELVIDADELRIYDNISSSMMELLTGTYTLQDIANQLAYLARVLSYKHLYFCVDEVSFTNHSRIQEDYPDEITLMLGIIDGTTYTGMKFKTKDVLPLLDNHSSSLVFAPLYYRKRTFGYIAFDFSHSSSYMHRIWVKNVRLAMENLRTKDELKRYSDQLEEISLHDPLTGLLNRRGLEKRAKALLSSVANGMLFAIYIDLDGLKRINDIHGHAAGDEAIRVIADMLRHCSRPGDIIARMGGDEFVCVGLVPDKKTLSSMLRTMHSYCVLHNEHSVKPYAVNASYGWFLQKAEEKLSLTQIIDKADSHLYKQKHMRKQQ